MLTSSIRRTWRKVALTDTVAIDVDPQQYPSGHFARLRDPDEGNPIELWEPAGETLRAKARPEGQQTAARDVSAY
jgi:hypothetical protein